VIGVIDDADLSDIALVGNSYGGMVVTGVADRVAEKVASLVYLDAFVLRTDNPVSACCHTERILPPYLTRTGW
jgi:pimeloyl-ACP methyl ester carboxylesterase